MRHPVPEQDNMNSLWITVDNSGKLIIHLGWVSSLRVWQCCHTILVDDMNINSMCFKWIRKNSLIFYKLFQLHFGRVRNQKFTQTINYQALGLYPLIILDMASLSPLGIHQELELHQEIIFGFILQDKNSTLKETRIAIAM